MFSITKEHHNRLDHYESTIWTETSCLERWRIIEKANLMYMLLQDLGKIFSSSRGGACPNQG